MEEKITIGNAKVSNGQGQGTAPQPKEREIDYGTVKKMIADLKAEGKTIDVIPLLLERMGVPIVQAMDIVQKEYHSVGVPPTVHPKALDKTEIAQKHNIPESAVGDFFEAVTETIEIPSKGYFNSNRKAQVTFKHLTPSEDDILYDRDLVLKNEHLNALLESSILDKDIRPLDLLTGDRNFLLIQLRRTGLGNLYEPGLMACSKCGHVHSPEVDLSKLRTKWLANAPDEMGEYAVTMPVRKIEVKFRFLNGHDEEMMAKFGNASMKKSGTHKVSKLMTQKYILQIMEVNGQRDKLYIKSFVNTMPMQDSAFFRKYVAELEPGIDLNYNFVCPACQHEEEKLVPITTRLFYPEFEG